ncbi:MAG: thioesterase family protein [Rhodobacteraceae bacterium]|jgi:acyl-CoA thioesterase FadM|nr:thioesterase family protein [Paracoccaceae bacterium]
MYPWFRMIKELVKYRNVPLHPLEPHVGQHICWPWDIDPWLELNNGRTLTLYDLGRIPMAIRTGLYKVARAKGWGMTVAGSSVRYRKRVKTFERFEMRSRLVGWDDRFVYMDQTMWRGGDCTSQALIRSAITQGARGIVDPAELALALGLPAESPPLPAWVQAWIDADATRPWPPEQ